jgi:serine/threonine-protein kinase
VFATAQYADIVHRDIKPANVFIMENGDFKIGDFGEAQFGASSVEHGEIAGTAYYLSPKKYYAMTNKTGDSTVTDNPYKSDVFSLGVTLLQMAILELPRSMHS